MIEAGFKGSVVESIPDEVSDDDTVESPREEGVDTCGGFLDDGADEEGTRVGTSGGCADEGGEGWCAPKGKIDTEVITSRSNIRSL